MRTDEEPVVVEQVFDVPLASVWAAITEPDRMRQWYFDNIPAFRPEVGFEVQFNIENEGRDFLHQWKITEAVPGKKLVHTWKFEAYPGNGFVEWELIPEKKGTRLRVTTIVTEDYPDEIPEFKRESCVAGWTYFINQRLKEYLDK